MKKNIFGILTLFIMVACTNSPTDPKRVNPSPSTAPTASPENKQEKLLNQPLPSNTPIPEPTVKLEDKNFKVEVKFDGILGRVTVNNGELNNTPFTYTLRGGRHDIYVFDLVNSGCQSRKYYLIDKDTVIDLKRKDICPAN